MLPGGPVQLSLRKVVLEDELTLAGAATVTDDCLGGLAALGLLFCLYQGLALTLSRRKGNGSRLGIPGGQYPFVDNHNSFTFFKDLLIILHQQ